MVRVLMIIGPDGFRSEEYFHPKNVLEENGVEVVTASLRKDAKSHLDEQVQVDMTLDEIEGDFDAVVLVGGKGGYVYLESPAHEQLIQVVKPFFENKIVAAICMAPSILAKAGLLKGRTATAHVSVEDEVKAGGANYTGNPVTVEGNLITGNGPEAAKDFGKAILEKLSL